MAGRKKKDWLGWNRAVRMRNWGPSFLIGWGLLAGRVSPGTWLVFYALPGLLIYMFVFQPTDAGNFRSRAKLAPKPKTEAA